MFKLVFEIFSKSNRILDGFGKYLSGIFCILHISKTIRRNTERTIFAHGAPNEQPNNRVYRFVFLFAAFVIQHANTHVSLDGSTRAVRELFSATTTRQKEDNGVPVRITRDRILSSVGLSSS